MDHDAQVAAFWADAQIRAGLNPTAVYTGGNIADTVPPPAWSFGDTPAQSDALLELVLAGRKTATASAHWEYEEEARQRAAQDEGDGGLLVRTGTDLDLALPQPGLLSIVLDGAGVPRALVRTTDVQVARFDEVDAEHARREGEGDGSLRQWRALHQQFFERNAPPGHAFGEDMLVVLERFEVLVPASARRAARRAGLR